MKLSCPNCGSRSYTEFWFGGEQGAHASSLGRVEDAEADFEDAWLRVNLAGTQRERWFHYAGCRRWHSVERDTRTNQVRAVD